MGWTYDYKKQCEEVSFGCVNCSASLASEFDNMLIKQGLGKEKEKENQVQYPCLTDGESED